MLVDVPLVNQLQPNTNDGMPSNNAQADCAAASCDAAAQALGAPGNLTPDWWKDAAYSEGYTGPTDPDHYASTFARFGLTVQEERNESGAALVDGIKAHLHAGHPVLGAIPSEWGLDYSAQDMVHFPKSTHEICFCDDDGANLTAMNPWPFSWTGNNAWYQKQPYAWFEQRLVYGRINPVVKEGVPTPVLSNTRFPAGVPAGWHDDGATLAAPNNGHRIVLGFRGEVLKGWDPANVPLGEEVASASIQPSDPSVGKGSRQDFLYGSLGYTPARGVFEIPVGHDLSALASNLQAEMTAADNARAQLASEQQQLDAAHKAATDAQVAQAAAEHEATTLQASLQASLNAANSNVATLTQQLSDLKAQLASAQQQQPPAPAPSPVPPVLPVPVDPAPVHPLPAPAPQPAPQPIIPIVPVSSSASAPSSPLSSLEKEAASVFNLFARANAKLPLLPWERTLLRAGEGILITAATAGGTALFQALANSAGFAGVNWTQVGSIALSAGVASLGFVLRKYFGALGDGAPAASSSPSSVPASQPAPAAASSPTA